MAALVAKSPIRSLSLAKAIFLPVRSPVNVVEIWFGSFGLRGLVSAVCNSVLEAIIGASYRRMRPRHDEQGYFSAAIQQKKSVHPRYSNGERGPLRRRASICGDRALVGLTTEIVEGSPR
jgi:hypothetical protein